MNPIEIIEYQECYKEDYITLSYEWLEKYVLVEPEDERILNHPKEAVLDSGGHIYFVLYDRKVVGTATLIKADNHTFELAKLAVTESFQGKKIGSRLIEKCINAAKQDGADRMILYTNHLLKAAIHLYERYGFREIRQEVKKYIEGDIEMELSL